MFGLRLALRIGLLGAALGACAASPGEVPDAAARPDTAASCSADSDCSDGRFCNGAERCDPTASSADARGCALAERPCDGVECDEDANRCLVPCDGVPDADADGAASIACGGDDCDDADANRFPGNVEVCDAMNVDEDCDPSTLGMRDADGDGHDDIACCNEGAGGALVCGDDCDDSMASIHGGATEVCNGVDEDCDGLVDDVAAGVVFCFSGETEACTTACGISGVATCRSDCLGFGACVGPEACNGCDDDLDGAVDDDFECARGIGEACTVPVCGTAGRRVCDADCAWERCVAPEICNFCDDDGDDGTYDDRLLASQDVTDAPIDTGCTGVAAGVARCVPTPIGTTGALDFVAELLPGTAIGEAGAYWWDLGMRSGWGPMRFVVDVEASITGPGTMPLGGWALVLSRGGDLTVGAGPDAGVPTGEGVSVRWLWSGVPDIDPRVPDRVDAFAFVSSGSRRGRRTDSNGQSISGANLDTMADGVRVQRIELLYTPDDPHTLADEENVVVVMGAQRFELFSSPPAGDITYSVLNDDYPIGSPLRIGITAATHSATVPGVPVTFGAPVRVRTRLTRMVPPMGPGGPTYTYDTSMSRADFCPGM